jgi:hypothetical protein
VIIGLEYIDAEHDGFYDLYNGRRYVLFLAARLDMGAEVGKITITAENAYIAFAAVEYNLLVEHRKSVKFLRASVADAGFKYKLDVKTDVYCVESAVELYGIKAYLCLSDTSAFHSHRACVFNYFLSAIGQKDLYVFEAVTVSARVKYPVGFYTNSFLAYAGAA